MTNKEISILILASVITFSLILFLGWVAFEAFGLYGLVVPLSTSGLVILFIIRLITQPFEERKEEIKK